MVYVSVACNMCTNKFEKVRVVSDEENKKVGLYKSFQGHTSVYGVRKTAMLLCYWKQYYLCKYCAIFVGIILCKCNPIFANIVLFFCKYNTLHSDSIPSQMNWGRSNLLTQLVLFLKTCQLIVA